MVVMWDLNVLGGKHKYLETLITEVDPDIILISETKMKRPVVPHLDIDNDNYSVVQLRSTNHGRVGLVVQSPLV